jgi:hypothetical protein
MPFGDTILEEDNAHRGVWLHLPAELRESALGLLARLAYRCVVARTTDETGDQEAGGRASQPSVADPPGHLPRPPG